MGSEPRERKVLQGGRERSAAGQTNKTITAAAAPALAPAGKTT